MTDIKSSIDIAYASSSPSQKLDLYWPSSIGESTKSIRLICFIHGGAWRSEDKTDHSELARRLAAVTGYIVAVPNYRLTPRSPTPETQLHHPAHAEDILTALEFLIGPSSPVFSVYSQDVSERPSVYLIGHSCSAHMLTCIFLDSTRVTPTLTPSRNLLSSVKAIAMSEGIYDIDLLIKHFPEYERGSFGFIANAFGDREDYSDVSSTSYCARPDGRHINWLVIHSKGDSLVDFPQSQAAYDHLSSEFGGGNVRKDFSTITTEHNEMLGTKDYSDLIGNYILSV